MKSLHEIKPEQEKLGLNSLQIDDITRMFKERTDWQKMNTPNYWRLKTVDVPSVADVRHVADWLSTTPIIQGRYVDYSATHAIMKYWENWRETRSRSTLSFNMYSPYSTTNTPDTSDDED